MAEASIRDLRNDGGRVIDRVIGGERIIVTRGGTPVAELRPLRRKPITREELVERFKNVPPIDLAELRAEMDAIIDPSL